MGDVVREDVNASMVRSWAISPITLRGRATRVWLAVAVAASIAAIVWWATAGTFAAGIFVALAIQGVAAMWFRNRVHDVVHAVDEPSRELDVLAGLLAILEHEPFQSPVLQRLQREIGGGGSAASAEISRLSHVVTLLSSRENLFFALPAALLLWTTQWAFAIEAWRSRVGAHLPRWLDAVGEFEALAASPRLPPSIPTTCFRSSSKAARLAATAVAHPVLGAGAIPNDVSLGETPVRLLIVSGSNMSGKSTLLRALGVNVVLASAGAPVRAAVFHLSPLQVGAALNLQDSLTEGRSRFFAEIRRLKQIVDLAKAVTGRCSFSSTKSSRHESHDRRIGARRFFQPRCRGRDRAYDDTRPGRRNCGSPHSRRRERALRRSVRERRAHLRLQGPSRHRPHEQRH
jgi:hypothetical protein